MQVMNLAEVFAVELGCCGYVAHLTSDFVKARRRDHKSFYCAACGGSRHYPGKSDLEILQGKLATTEDLLATARKQRDKKERERRAEKAAKTRLKNRIAAGVCPCCKRHFENIERHMTTQHPKFREEA